MSESRAPAHPELALWDRLIREVRSMSIIGNYADELLDIQARAIMLAERSYGENHRYVQRLSTVLSPEVNGDPLLFGVRPEPRRRLLSLLRVIREDWALTIDQTALRTYPITSH